MIQRAFTKQAGKGAAAIMMAAALLAGCTSGSSGHAAHGSSVGQESSANTGVMNMGHMNMADNAGQSSSAPGGAGDVSMPWIATKNTTRVNTASPAEAAVLTARMLWPAMSDSSRPGAVILTDGSNWAVAAAAAHLIHHPNNGPVLYVEKNNIPEVSMQELQRLQPIGAGGGVQVILVGDLGEAIEKQVKDAGFKTARVEGTDPASAAAAADDYYIQAAGETPKSVMIGSAEDAGYSLPAAYWSAHMPEPLLYAGKDSLPAATAAALKKRGGAASIYIIGPQQAVSSKVEKELAAYGHVTRIAGKDAYSTAVAFARYKDSATGFGWGIQSPGHNVTLANLNTPELALAGAPFAHLGKHTPLLWTDAKRMPDSVMDYVMTLQPKYNQSPVEGPYSHAWLLGTEEQLSSGTQAELDSMLEVTSASGGGHGMAGMGH